MSELIPVLTIDGPTASGKGTVARAVAAALGFHLLDSGAIYRAFALAVLNRKVDQLKINDLEMEAKALSLEFRDDSVWLNGADSTELIRAEAVGMLASKLSAVPEVRAALLARQRAFAQPPGLVGDGRDMGTVVFPDATLKIYLTTTSDVRATRRHRQLEKHASDLSAQTQRDSKAKRLIEKGNSSTIDSSLESFASVEEKIRQRDTQDKTRAVAPLKPAPDAIVIDNAAHGPQQTIDAVLSLWKLRSR
ncbi:MAG: (d)CMP kinase [Betaproteobacteria bacterium]|nr:MAG: (d)CMP kinase [Betaproteobacteria bacterium]